MSSLCVYDFYSGGIAIPYEPHNVVYSVGFDEKNPETEEISLHYRHNGHMFPLSFVLHSVEISRPLLQFSDLVFLSDYGTITLHRTGEHEKEERAEIRTGRDHDQNQEPPEWLLGHGI